MHYFDVYAFVLLNLLRQRENMKASESQHKLNWSWIEQQNNEEHVHYFYSRFESAPIKEVYYQSSKQYTNDPSKSFKDKMKKGIFLFEKCWIQNKYFAPHHADDQETAVKLATINSNLSKFFQ